MLTLRVHVKGFLASDLHTEDLLAACQTYARHRQMFISYRVCPDNRMLRLNRLATCNASSVDTAVDLLNARVHSTQSV